MRFNNSLADGHHVLSGVPQGSILGPLLFIMFINDVADVLRHCRIIKYADDTVFYVSDRCFEVIQNRLNDLENLAAWLENND